MSFEIMSSKLNAKYNCFSPEAPENFWEIPELTPSYGLNLDSSQNMEMNSIKK